jgi:hypothetical protein
MSAVIVSETQNADYTFDNINIIIIERFFKKLSYSNIGYYGVSSKGLMWDI